MAREDPLFGLRIPQEFKDLLTQRALENKRSVTAEILSRLEKSLQPGPLDGATASQRDLIEEILELGDRDVDAILEIIGSARASAVSISMEVKEMRGEYRPVSDQAPQALARIADELARVARCMQANSGHTKSAIRDTRSHLDCGRLPNFPIVDPDADDRADAIESERLSLETE